MKHLILLCEMAEETQRLYSLSPSPPLSLEDEYNQTGQMGIGRELCVSVINRGAVLENTERNRPPTFTPNTLTNFQLNVQARNRNQKVHGVQDTTYELCVHPRVYSCFGLGPLVLVKGNLDAVAYNNLLDNNVLPSVLGRPSV